MEQMLQFMQQMQKNRLLMEQQTAEIRQQWATTESALLLAAAPNLPPPAIRPSVPQMPINTILMPSTPGQRSSCLEHFVPSKASPVAPLMAAPPVATDLCSATESRMPHIEH